jgi:hypothetical protein
MLHRPSIQRSAALANQNIKRTWMRFHAPDVKGSARINNKIVNAGSGKNGVKPLDDAVCTDVQNSRTDYGRNTGPYSRLSFPDQSGSVSPSLRNAKSASKFLFGKNNACPSSIVTKRDFQFARRVVGVCVAFVVRDRPHHGKRLLPHPA